MKPIFKNALRNAFATSLYIASISLFLFYVTRLFDQADSVLIPITMLSLFVFSAAFTGMLVFGQPILWYLDGKKQEAVSLFVMTLLVLLIITLIVLHVLILF